MLKALPYFLAVAVVLAGAVNFFWVLGASNRYGGGALAGFVRDGHYYVGVHGSYTEVSRAIWEDIRVHELTFFVGAPLVFGCFVYLLVGGVLPWMVGLRRGEAVVQRVRAVRASGVLLARARCAGNVAGFRLGFPAAIGIELYPAGLIVRVALEPTVAIFREELTRVEMPKGLLQRWVEITFRSPDIQSPLLLSLSRASDLAVALRQFMDPTGTHVD